MAHARSSWENAGLGEEAGRVLEFLVTRPQSVPADIGAALGLPPQAVATTLAALSEELLAVQVASDPERWSASPPRPSLQALVARRRVALAEIEALSERLQSDYSAASGHSFASGQFEVLDTPALVTARYTHLLRTAKSAICHLAMPPYVADSGQVPERLAAQAAAVASGVRTRAVYDADTFGDALSLLTAREGNQMGGEVRVADGLPMKLVIFDAAAIMPLRVDDPAAGSLLVHSPPLLHALGILFEELWDRGIPWGSDGTAAPPAPAGELPDERGMEVLRLLSLGMKDDVIARVLGVSRRTVQQSITDLGMLAGARTRFQIAIVAQQRGWLPGPPAKQAPAPAEAPAIRRAPAAY